MGKNNKLFVEEKIGKLLLRFSSTCYPKSRKEIRLFSVLHLVSLSVFYAMWAFSSIRYNLFTLEKRTEI